MITENVTITAYHLGPEVSGNTWGGISSRSPQQLANKPRNTECLLVIKKEFAGAIAATEYSVFVADRSDWSSPALDPTLRPHITTTTEADYLAKSIEWDALVGTTKNGLVWEKSIATMTNNVSAAAEAQYPALSTQFKNLTFSMLIAMAHAVSTGKVITPAETVTARNALCEACPRFVSADRRCLECGCDMDYKMRMAAMSCPLGKWGPV
jgi:hypothetical protein